MLMLAKYTYWRKLWGTHLRFQDEWTIRQDWRIVAERRVPWSNEGVSHKKDVNHSWRMSAGSPGLCGCLGMADGPAVLVGVCFRIARGVCVWGWASEKSVTLVKSSQWRLLKLPVWWGWLLNENQSSSLNWCLYYLPFIFVMSSSSFESIIFTLAVYILSLLPNIWSKLWG